MPGMRTARIALSCFQASCRNNSSRTTLLQCQQFRQLAVLPAATGLGGGTQHQSAGQGKPRWSWWQTAGAVGGLSAGLAAATCSPAALADSSSMQMQQTHSAHNAAKASQHGSGSSDAGGGGMQAEGNESSLNGLMEYFADATDYMADLFSDLYTHAEARLSSLLQQPSDEPVAVRLVAFAAALLPVIFATGLAYRYASGSSLSEALYKMYCLLIRVEAGPEPNRWSYLVTNIVFLVGFFTLAVLLGVVNDEVQKRADDHRHGRNPVKASDHILILNWNENTPALLQNIAVAISSAAEAAGPDHQQPGRASSRAGAAPVSGLRGDLWSKNPTVVLLADKSKEEMDAAIQEQIRDRGYNLTVHTRQGHPFRPSQLKKVSAHQAAIMVLLHPEAAPSPADAEALKAAVAMAFTTLPARDDQQKQRYPKQQRMVVQMPASVPEAGNVLKSVQSTSAGTSDAANLRVQVLSLPDQLLTNRLVAQTAAQPGLLTCWLDLLAPDATSTNFVCVPLPPEMETQTYRNIRRSFSDDVICGFIDAQGTVNLNPDDAIKPGPGVRLVMLSNGTGTLSPAAKRQEQQAASRTLYEHAAVAAAERLRRAAAYKYKPRHILVASWADDHMGELIRSFAEFAPVGSTVTFIGQAPPMQCLPKQMGNVSRFEFVKHPYPTSLEALVAAGVKSAHCVVLGTGPGHPTDAGADARVLASLLQVQEAVHKLRLPEAPHVVAPICEVGSSSMALRYLDKLTAQGLHQQQQDAQAQQQPRSARKKANSAALDPKAVLKPEFLIFRNITSAVVAQAASEPAYADIVTALLFSREGQEVYLRPPASFNIPLNHPISFAEIQELARIKKQTALGYISTNNHSSEPDAPGGGTNSSSSSSSKGGGGQHGSGVSSERGRAVSRLMPWAHSVIQKLSRAACVRLGLSAADQVVLKDGDWIVVLAEDF